MTDRVDELLARFLAEVTERPGRSWSSRGPSTPLEGDGRRPWAAERRHDWRLVYLYRMGWL